MPVPDLTAVDAALEHGECERALELLAELYEQDQQVPEVNSRIADALFALQRHDEAEGMYTWLAENHRDSLARRRARECRERIASMSSRTTSRAAIVCPAWRRRSTMRSPDPSVCRVRVSDTVSTATNRLMPQA